MNVHHVAPVASHVFKFGPAYFAGVPLNVGVRQDVVGDLLLRLERLPAKLADFGPEVQVNSPDMHVQ